MFGITSPVYYLWMNEKYISVIHFLILFFELHYTCKCCMYNNNNNNNNIFHSRLCQSLMFPSVSGVSSICDMHPRFALLDYHWRLQLWDLVPWLLAPPLYGADVRCEHSLWVIVPLLLNLQVHATTSCCYMSHAGSWKVFLGHIVILTAQLL